MKTGGTTVNLRGVAATLAAALAILLLAGACAGSGENGVETPAAGSAPAPTEPASAPPDPPEPTEPVTAPEPQPAVEPAEPVEEPAEPVEEPPEPPAATAAPAPTTEPSEETETAIDAPAGPESQEASADLLDEAAASAVAARIIAAREGVVSERIGMYMSLRMSFPGEPTVSVDGVPLGTLTAVGDLAQIEVDVADLAGGMLASAGATDPELADLQPLRMVIEGEERVYLKLAPFLALDPHGPAPWLQELADEHGDDLDELWLLVDLVGGTPESVLEDLGLMAQTESQDDYLGLLAGGLQDGALLEARRGERSRIGGVEVQEYAFVFDMAALEELPEMMQDVLGDSLGEGESPSGGFLSGLTEPVPVELSIHVDEEDFIWRMDVAMDMAVLFAAIIEDLVGLGEVPEDEMPELLAIEFVFAFRLDTIALNDPSLLVELPDPSLVVEVSDPLLGADLY